MNLDELYDMDGQELLDELMKSHVSTLQCEGNHVETLLDAAVLCEQKGPDAKAEALIEWIYQLQVDENEQDLKVLIFTEFVPTQNMLKEFLEARNISVATLNGSMDLEERKQAQDAFRKSHRVLVSTDAGWRRPESAVCTCHYQLRHSLEPDATGTADRPRGPHRPVQDCACDKFSN